ncbi:fibronectin type III domain-containing protein [Blastococcus sp. SYSU D00813]
MSHRRGRATTVTPPGRPHRRYRRLLVLLTAALLLPVGVATSTTASAENIQPNPGQLVQAGPVSAVHGFPAWYEDSAGRRLEPCVDHQNPLCDIPVDHVPNPSAPMSFPDNFASEVFYQLVAADITLRGGGTASLTLALEGAWMNEVVTPGQQTVFARLRVDVRDAAAGATFTFQHPFGKLTVTTDDRGRGRYVEDVTPALGNFDTPLAGNFGPFLRWRPGVLPNPPAGYVGDPAVLHQVTGSPTGFNRFTAWQGTVQMGTTDMFSVSGKIATNTGLTVDMVRVNGGFLDVFATSRGSQLEVVGQEGRFPATPMEKDPGSDRFYARIPLQAGAALPTDVTVRNPGDDPVSTRTYAISGLTVTQAGYDGTNLVVSATAIAPATYPLEVVGFKDATGQPLKLTSAAPLSIPSVAPPATVTVKDAAGTTATLPVTVTGGPASPAGTSTGGGGGTTPDPAGVPGAPTGVTATPGDGQASVTWAAPASTGTSPILRYVVTATDPATGTVVVRLNADAGARSTVVPDLVNGVRVVIRVRAVNAAGAGPVSAPVSVTPVAGA